MNASRGLSQILFGFLPEQTVDLSGRVWWVKRWVLPHHVPVDAVTLRKELLRAIKPWSDAGKDGRFAEDLRRGLPVAMLQVNERRGVEVEQFPKVFRCRVCSRLEYRDDRQCACGHLAWVQWHFVAYHDCGYIGSPRFGRCDAHRQVRVQLSGTAAARDLVFSCPVCNKQLHKGFLFMQCENCDEGGLLKHDVHRASQVYSARTLTLVNPPDETTAAVLRDPTAAVQKLEWVLEGMPDDAAAEGGTTVETVVAALMAANIPEAAARAQAERMLEDGVIGAGSGAGALDLPAERMDVARDAALRLWLATSGGRRTIAELVDQASAAQLDTYRRSYPQALRRTGLESIDLLEDFPVLTCRFGYTRGPSTPGESTLRRYRTRDGGVAVHGELSGTEGLLFRLDPVQVAAWLAAHGHLAEAPADPADARKAILAVAEVPEPWADAGTGAGADLMTLVHSLSHRIVRRIASFAGIERDAIAEYLVPEHLAFVLYAGTRGDFVLGGMQALFEHDLHTALAEVYGGETRCALDPGCREHGRACVACLHLGEPSCRHYNRWLDRDVLFGAGGYFAFRREADEEAVALSAA